MPWLVDQAYTRVGFSIKHMLVASVRGQFRRYTCSLNIDRNEFTRSTFSGEIEMDSLDTDNRERDGLVRSHAVLGALLRFQSSGVERRAAGQYQVRGTLTLRGIDKPVVLQVDYQSLARDVGGDTRCSLRVRATLSRKAYGVSFGMLEAGGLSVGDSVNVEIDAQAVWQEPVAAADQ